MEGLVGACEGEGFSSSVYSRCIAKSCKAQAVGGGSHESFAIVNLIVISENDEKFGGLVIHFGFIADRCHSISLRMHYRALYVVLLQSNDGAIVCYKSSYGCGLRPAIYLPATCPFSCGTTEMGSISSSYKGTLVTGLLLRPCPRLF